MRTIYDQSGGGHHLRGKHQARQIIRTLLKIFAVAALLGALALAARGADAVFNFADFQASGLTNAKVTLTPLSTPRIDASPFLILSDALTFTTDTNASFTVTNLAPGNYRVTVQGKWTNTTFLIQMPETNSSQNVTGILAAAVSQPGATAGYTQTAADARFIRWASPQILTNVNARGAFSLPPATVTLTADNTAIATATQATVLLASDSAVANDRTFTLSAGTTAGQLCVLIFGAGAAELPDSGNVTLSAAWSPSAGDALVLLWSGTSWVELSRADK